jgi:hypothetical protein
VAKGQIERREIEKDRQNSPRFKKYCKMTKRKREREREREREIDRERERERERKE